MFQSRFTVLVITGWFLAMGLLAGARFAAGLSPSPVHLVSTLLILFLPPILALMLFRGAPPQGIAAVLYQADRANGSRAAEPPPDPRETSRRRP